MKLLAKNKRAYFDYDITDKYIAGVVLTGSEVKSAKQLHASLKGSFVIIRGGEAWLTNAQISPYAQASGPTAFDPSRTRKLLLHKRQLSELGGKMQAGYSLVPLALVQERNLIKLEIGLGRSKKKFDKRQVIKRRDTEREIGRRLKK